MIRPFIGLLLIVIILLIGLAYARHLLTHKLYQPVKRHAKRKLPPFRELYVSTETGNWSDQGKIAGEDNIHLWHFHRYPGNKTVLYFHGNSYNISYREYMVRFCEMLKLNLLLVDYRGYGRSDGKPSCQNILRDARVATKYLINHEKEENIIVWCESLGSSPGTYIASKYPNLAGLLVFSGFASFHTLLEDANGPIRYLIYELAKAVSQDIQHNTNNVEMIAKVKCPVMIIHSREDTLIPFRNATNLYRSVQHPNKRLVEIKGDHDDPQLTVETVAEIADFIGVELDNRYHSNVKDIINNIGKEFITERIERKSDGGSDRFSTGRSINV